MRHFAKTQSKINNQILEIMSIPWIFYDHPHKFNLYIFLVILPFIYIVVNSFIMCHQVAWSFLDASKEVGIKNKLPDRTHDPVANPWAHKRKIQPPPAKYWKVGPHTKFKKKKKIPAARDQLAWGHEIELLNLRGAKQVCGPTAPNFLIRTGVNSFNSMRGCI